MGFPLEWLDIAQQRGLVADSEPGPSLDCSEKEFQAAVVALAKRHGWDRKYHTFDSRRSDEDFPDLVLSHPDGRMVVMELKSELGTATPGQLLWLDRFRAAGVPALLVKPSDWPRIVDVLTSTGKG